MNAQALQKVSQRCVASLLRGEALVTPSQCALAEVYGGYEPRPGRTSLPARSHEARCHHWPRGWVAWGRAASQMPRWIPTWQPSVSQQLRSLSCALFFCFWKCQALHSCFATLMWRKWHPTCYFFPIHIFLIFLIPGNTLTWLRLSLNYLCSSHLSFSLLLALTSKMSKQNQTKAPREWIYAQWIHCPDKELKFFCWFILPFEAKKQKQWLLPLWLISCPGKKP